MSNVRPPYFAMANNDPMSWIDDGIDVDHLGVHLLAWAECSTHVTDGLLTGIRVRRLPGWTQRRQDRLVARGLWQYHAETDIIELTDYLTTNKSRAEIMALRAKRQKAGHDGGEATAEKARRTPEGTFAGAR